MTKRTNNELQNTTHNLKSKQHELHSKLVVNWGALEGWVVPAPLNDVDYEVRTY